MTYVIILQSLTKIGLWVVFGTPPLKKKKCLSFEDLCPTWLKVKVRVYTTALHNIQCTNTCTWVQDHIDPQNIHFFLFHYVMFTLYIAEIKNMGR